MSFTKSLLLGSAAVLATVVGAQAADLPSKKAAPATYVKICDAYGAGFFFIPGTETCVKLGGYVRAEYQYTPGKDMINPNGAAATNFVSQSKNLQSETGYEVRGRIDVDARTPTSMGVARTFVRLRSANTSGIRNTTPGGNLGIMTDAPNNNPTVTIESAMVQWAGFTFGNGPENYAFMPPFMYNGTAWAGFPTGMKQIAYTATLGGGLSATVALEDRKDFGYDQTLASRPSTGANLVANIRTDQSWGFAALHGLVGNNAINKSIVDGGVGQKTYTGWGIGVTASYKLPMIAAGDQIWVTANYADGAIGALLGGGALNNISTAAQRRLLGGVLRQDANVVLTNQPAGALAPTNVATFGTTKGWNVGTIFTHYWAAQWRSNFAAAYVELTPPTTTTVFTWGKGKFWEVGANIIYSPAKDFDIGLELLYANMKNRVQNDTLAPAAWRNAGSPGLSENNVTTKLRVERQF